MKVRKIGCRRSQGQNGELKDQFPQSLEDRETLKSEDQKLLHDVLQSKPRGSCKADKARENKSKNKNKTTNLIIGTCNTRTIRTEDDLDHLMEELENIKWDVVGLCETKRSGEGLSELPGGHLMFECNKTEERPTAKGIAILINKNLKDFVQKFDIHSDRAISCQLNLKNNKNIQIMQVYAPQSGRPDEEIEMFYEEVEKAIERKTCQYNIVMGEFNAKIGQKSKNETTASMGFHGIGERNDR